MGDQKSTVEPLNTPVTPLAVAGVAIWGVLALVLLGFRGWLTDHGHTRWLWTCVAGFLWGLVGLYVVARHDRRQH